MTEFELSSNAMIFAVGCVVLAVLVYMMMGKKKKKGVEPMPQPVDHGSFMGSFMDEVRRRVNARQADLWIEGIAKGEQEAQVGYLVKEIEDRKKPHTVEVVLKQPPAPAPLASEPAPNV